MLLLLNYRFQKLFKKYILSVNSVSTSYASGYNSNLKHIYFYEWSSLNCGSKVFTNTSDFYKYLKEHNINYTEEQKMFLEENNWSYCVCAPGKNILLTADRYLDLQDTLTFMQNQLHNKESTALAIISL